MSWKYSTSSSYLPRDATSTRDPGQTQGKFGLSSHGKLGSSTLERRTGWSSNLSGDSKFFRNLVEPVEHSPVWSRTNSVESSASVQRLKDRYNLGEEPAREKRSDAKEPTATKAAKFYGRSYTSFHVDDKPSEGTTSYSKFRRKLDKPEVEKNTSAYALRLGTNLRTRDPPKTLNIPCEAFKLPSRRYTNDLSPTISRILSSEEKTAVSNSRKEVSDADEVMVTVVTRGTSPTPTSSTVYLRSKRTDYGVEKKVKKPRTKPEMVHKEIQTDKEEISLSKYSIYSDTNVRTKPWSSYSDKYSPLMSYNTKFTSRSSGYGSDTRRDHLCSIGSLSPSECKRSVSREESDDLATPESPVRSPTGKPPLVKETDKKLYARKSPPSNFRLPLKLESPKVDGVRNSSSPASPLHCKITSLESPKTPCKIGGGQSPQVTIDRCPDIMQAIADASSASESSEEESSSDEESNDEPASPALTIKKSITNFLQNIPNSPTQRQTRSNLFLNASNHKVNFRRIESGEKAWWMESTDKVPDGIANSAIAKAKSTRSVPAEVKSPESVAIMPGNFLSPSFATNNKLAAAVRDKSRASCEEDSPREGKPRPTEDGFNSTLVHLSNGFANGDRSGHYINVHSPVNSFPVENDSHSPMKFTLQVDESLNDGTRYLNDFPREHSIKDVHQKLCNGLGSPNEDTNHLDPGNMAGLISKMKEELNKPKVDVRRSFSREMSPMVADPKSEIDLYWKELADSVNRPLRLCDLDFTDLNTDDESDVPGHMKMNGDIPAPPPMLILPTPVAAPPKPVGNGGVPAPPGLAPVSQPPPQRNFKIPPPPMIPQVIKNKKTVKLFWKEVKDEPAMMMSKVSTGGGQIWDELSEVKVDTLKLEYLFESRAKDLISKKQQEQGKNKEVIVLDPKRSNAINIGMTKLPPPRAIKTAILKMDSTVINKEGIEKVLTMLPTEEEKLRIQEAQSSNPDVPLGSAEQFLLTLSSISQLEARLRLWAFKLDFENSEREICEPLMDLKQGMEILRVNKTFRSILSTLLSVGNFLNGYDVKGFQIEYLSKVPEVKDTVHKHSLLHHLCIIVMEKFPDSTDLYSEVGAVTRASKVDFDELAANIKKLEEECKLSWNYLKMIAKHEGHTAMKVRMSDFLADCAERIIVLGIVHRRIMARFHKFAYWLGVPVNRISTTRPNEIFKIVSEFALEFRTTRDRVLQQIKKMNREKSRSRGCLCADGNEIKMNSKEAKDDAKLKQLLGKETTYGENMNMQTWRRRRKDAKNILQETNQNEAEILETLIKTANQKSPFKERRRSRAHGKCC